MLEFVNWFFSFFANFVDLLISLPVLADVPLGVLICSVCIFLIVGRFLLGYWKDKSLGGGSDDAG